MENNSPFPPEPKYTMRWLGKQTMFVLIITFVLSVITGFVDNLAYSRVNQGLMSDSCRDLITETTTYRFVAIAIVMITLMLVEIAFRKSINYVQYGLIACSMSLFYLLLLAMAEKMPFWVAYIIVTGMTVALNSLFVKGLTQSDKAMRLITVLLVGEYAATFMLVYLGSMALLIGSLLMFGIIAVAMYFTLKLKVENDELVLK